MENSQTEFPFYSFEAPEAKNHSGHDTPPYIFSATTMTEAPLSPDIGSRR